MSTNEITISAKVRDCLSKRNNRSLRESEFVPAVVYCKGGNVNIAVSTKSLPKKHSAAQVITLDLGTSQKNVIMREVQVNPLTSQPVHFDFQEVNAESVIETRIPLEFFGLTREQEKEGAFKSLVRSILVKGKVSSFPESIKVDVSGLKIEDVVFLETLQIPEGIKLVSKNRLAIAQLSRK